MVNPSLQHLLANERERDLRRAVDRHLHVIARRSRLREQLGWSLIGLGAHLVSSEFNRRFEVRPARHLARS